VLAGQVQARPAAPVHSDGQDHQRNNAFSLHARRAQQVAVVVRVAGFKAGAYGLTGHDHLYTRRTGGNAGGLSQKRVAQALGGMQNKAAIGFLKIQPAAIKVLQAQHGVQNGSSQGVAVGAANHHIGKRDLQALVHIGPDKLGNIGNHTGTKVGAPLRVTYLNAALGLQPAPRSVRTGYAQTDRRKRGVCGRMEQGQNCGPILRMHQSLQGFNGQGLVVGWRSTQQFDTGGRWQQVLCGDVKLPGTQTRQVQDFAQMAQRMHGRLRSHGAASMFVGCKFTHLVHCRAARQQMTGFNARMRVMTGLGRSHNQAAICLWGPSDRN
jgi:hypothetical protein